MCVEKVFLPLFVHLVHLHELVIAMHLDLVLPGLVVVNVTGVLVPQVGDVFRHVQSRGRGRVHLSEIVVGEGLEVLFTWLLEDLVGRL
jgi:hypothetical protein